MSDSPQTYNADPQRAIAANSSYANRSIASSLPIADKPQFSSIGPFGNHYTIDSTAGSIAGTGVGFNDLDNKSVTSKQSKLSKFTYSEYPQIKPTNPLYTSTNTLRTAASHASRATTMNTVSRRHKYNPNQPRRIRDHRWTSALALLFFFPTGLVALGLALKAHTKFNDGFIDDAKKLNARAFAICCCSFLLGVAWIMAMFFLVDKWPRSNG